jgi:DNA-binding phage protein
MSKGYSTFNVKDYLNTEEDIQNFLNAMRQENNPYAYQQAEAIVAELRAERKVTQ